MKRIILVLLTLTLGLINVVANDVTFKASAPQAVAVGQKFYLQYNITNADPSDFQEPDMSKFSVLMGPEKSTGKQVQIINGKYSSTFNVAYTYVLVAQKEGTFTLSPARFTHNGKTMMSNSLTIKVMPENTANSNAQSSQYSHEQMQSSSTGISDEDLFCVAEYNRKKVCEQDQIITDIILYHKGNIREYTNLKFPEYNGFICQDIEIKDEERNLGVKVYNGKKYYAYLLKKSVLFPQRSGKLDIEDGKMTVIAQVSRRRRSYWDDEFFSGMAQNVKKDLVIKGTQIEVTPLPSNGKNDDFSGGVGSFKVESSINSSSVKANEALNLKIKITGSGNIKYIKEPVIDFPKDFEIYDPKVTNKIKATDNGVSGTKEIEYLVIPRFAGTYEIPAVTFSYFDPKSKTYKSLSTEAYSITVEKGESTGESSSAVVSNYNNKEDVKFLGKDIRFINSEDTNVKSDTRPFFGTTGFYLWLIIPLCIFITLFILYRKQLKENANITLVKNKRANKLATKRLKKAQQHLKADEKEAYYEEVLKALWGYTSDKLNIPVAELDKDNIEAKLAQHQVGEEVVKEFLNILNTCEFARFAPTSGHGEMDTLYEKVVELISTLEDQIKK